VGVTLVAISEAVQKCEDVFRDAFLNSIITEFLDESFDDGLVGSYRIFSSNGSCGQSIQIFAALDRFMAYLLR
jgi:hypothetical protein